MVESLDRRRERTLFCSHDKRKRKLCFFPSISCHKVRFPMWSWSVGSLNHFCCSSQVIVDLRVLSSKIIRSPSRLRETLFLRPQVLVNLVSLSSLHIAEDITMNRGSSQLISEDCRSHSFATLTTVQVPRLAGNTGWSIQRFSLKSFEIPRHPEGQAERTDLVN